MLAGYWTAVNRDHKYVYILVHIPTAKANAYKTTCLSDNDCLRFQNIHENVLKCDGSTSVHRDQKSMHNTFES